MPDEPIEDTQKTRPKKGEPIEIPIPPKPQIMRDFEKVATRPTVEDEDDDSKDAD